jgi:hypothetical protein
MTFKSRLEKLEQTTKPPCTGIRFSVVDGIGKLDQALHGAITWGVIVGGVVAALVSVVTVGGYEVAAFKLLHETLQITTGLETFL